MVAWLYFSTTYLPTMPAYTHTYRCSLFKTGRKTTLRSIVLHKKRVQLLGQLETVEIEIETGN